MDPHFSKRALLRKYLDTFKIVCFRWFRYCWMQPKHVLQARPFWEKEAYLKHVFLGFASSQQSQCRKEQDINIASRNVGNCTSLLFRTISEHSRKYRNKSSRTQLFHLTIFSCKTPGERNASDSWPKEHLEESDFEATQSLCGFAHLKLG